MAAQTQPLRDKITELDRQIEDHQRRLSEAITSRRHLQEVLATMTGGEQPQAQRRQRASNVKGVVLEVMERAGASGLTSAEVVAAAQAQVTNAQRETISSLLSRLKKDGALVYDGLRYYDAKWGPKDGEHRPFRPHVQAVA